MPPIPGWRLPLAGLRLLGLLLISIPMTSLVWLLIRFGRQGRTLTQLWGRACLAIIGMRFRKTGDPAPNAALIVGNHVSWIDIFAYSASMPVFFIAKEEVRSWPIMGWMSVATGTLFLARDPTQVRRQREYLRAQMLSGRLLCLFPEGTTSDGMRLLPFKSSFFSILAAEDGKGIQGKIQPVSVQYHPPEGSDLPPSYYSWWGETDFAKHATNVLARGQGGCVTIRLHPPVRAEDYPDRKALAHACHCIIAKGLGVSVSKRTPQTQRPEG